MTNNGEGTPSRSLSRAVIEAVAEEEGVHPSALSTPLFDAIDPDSLNSLFTPMDNGHSRPTGRVSFFYAGYEVTADSTGAVELRKASGT
jgi:hypothetical protein